MPLLKLREEEFQLRKFFSLFLNEMLKIRKKVAVFVMVIVMTVGMIGCSVIFKIEGNIGEENYYNDEEYIEYCIENEKWLKEELKTLMANGDTEDPYYKDSIYKLKIESQSYYLDGTYAKENNITDTSFKKTLTASMNNYYERMVYAELYSEEGTQSKEYIYAKAEYERLDNIIKTSNYKQYIEDENKRIEESEMPEENKKSSIAYNNALYKICPTGEYDSYRAKENAENLLSQKKKIEDSLMTGVDFNTNSSISEERREELELSLAVINKKIDEALLTGSTSGQVNGESFILSLSFGNLMTTIILIVIAAAMMSGETSTGTIKSLIIAPVKRWKIYLSKYLALIFVSVVLSLYTYIISALANGLLFGFSSFGTEVYVAFGKVITINFLTLQLIYTVCSLVPLIIVVTFAYMMSVISKNTAAAAAVTMGAYLGGTTLQLLVMSFLYNRVYVTRFLPLSNMDWFNLIFKTMSEEEISMNVIMGGSLSDSPSSLTFAIVYVAVLLVCMLWIGLESFCKKDIK